MNITDIKELYSITPIENCDSIFTHGILSHNRIKQLQIRHKSIADVAVQDRRKDKILPGGKHKLHDFVNLYFNPRNAMMFKRKPIHQEMCVLGVTTDLLNDRSSIVTDGNASSEYTRFFAAPDGIKMLDKRSVFTKDWRDPDHYEMCRKRSAVCAELLVSNTVPVTQIQTVYVSYTENANRINKILQDKNLDLPIKINGKMFFQEDDNG